jgi:hypothetical protein
VQPVKPKIDSDMEILNIKKMLAKVIDALNIQMPAQEMVTDANEMTQAGMEAQGMGGGAPAGDSGGAGGGSAIPPIEPMQGAAPEKAGQDRNMQHVNNGQRFKTAGLAQITNRAAAVAACRGANRSAG